MPRVRGELHDVRRSTATGSARIADTLKGAAMVDSPHSLLRAMFDAAIGAALPEKIVPRHLPAPPKGRTIVVGAGKASAAMARAVEEHWPTPVEGLGVTRYGRGFPCRHIEIVEAAHPFPDPAGSTAARRILDLGRQAGPDDLVLCLISG